MAYAAGISGSGLVRYPVEHVLLSGERSRYSGWRVWWVSLWAMMASQSQRIGRISTLRHVSDWS